MSLSGHMPRHKDPDQIEYSGTSARIPRYLHEMARIFNINISENLHTSLDNTILRILSESPDWIKQYPTDEKSRSYLREFDHRHKTTFSSQKKFYQSLTVPDIFISVDDLADVFEGVIQEDEGDIIAPNRKPVFEKKIPRNTRSPEIKRRIHWFRDAMRKFITSDELDEYVERMNRFKIEYNDVILLYEKRMEIAEDYYNRIKSRSPAEEWELNGLDWESPFKESIEMIFYSIYIEIDDLKPVVQNGKIVMNE